VGEIPGRPNRVRVTARLVNTANETDLWAQVYDEPLDGSSACQSDIAEKCAVARITLRDPQRSRGGGRRRTGDLKAYATTCVARLAATEHRGAARGAGRANGTSKAVSSSDPGFRGRIRELSGCIPHVLVPLRPLKMSRGAKRAVDRAFELAPDLPEAHHSLGAYISWGVGLRPALQEFAIAGRESPERQ